MRHVRPIALMCCLIATACGAASPLVPTILPSPATTAPPRTAPAGLSVLNGHVVGAPSSHRFTVFAPAGWIADENIVVDSDSFVAGLKVTWVARVPRDPCHWKDSLVPPGPTVDDLVELLVAQRLRNSSTPVEVTLAGYSGKFLEWSVPDDMVVTGDADFRGCDQTDEGHTDFISWIGKDGGHRYHKGPGERDRLWILDVEGQTTVIDISWAASAPSGIRDELIAIVETLEFETR